MAFKSFRLQILLRIAFLSATLLIAVYLILESSFYATTAVSFLAALAQVAALVTYVERSNSDLVRFLEAIKYSDFSQSFTAKGKGASFDKLAIAFNQVMDEFRKLRGDREEQFNFLQTLIQHVGVGLLSFTPEGVLGIMNPAAKRLLRVTHLTNLWALEPSSPELVHTLLAMKPGGRVVIKIDDFPEPLQLVVHATEIRLHEQPYTLVSLQNIQPELEEMEMEAWQKLIRVLTHEIMNSITPISSLASTAEVILQDQKFASVQGEARSGIDDLQGAMKTITKRTEGLLHFVDAYRNLTLIPRPELQIFPLAELVQRVDRLLRAQMAGRDIMLISRVDPESLEVNADPRLMEQVLINLLQNALYAVRNREQGRIQLTAQLDPRGHVSIEVADNGTGISEDTMQKIFVPFFTTKEKGSGIGLNLSRQIVRMHGGTITCRSKEGKGAVFTIRL
jgi:two-component system nitrogen regulation sensor histidine kinase NtrY